MSTEPLLCCIVRAGRVRIGRVAIDPSHHIASHRIATFITLSWMRIRVDWLHTLLFTCIFTELAQT